MMSTTKNKPIITSFLCPQGLAYHVVFVDIILQFIQTPLSTHGHIAPLAQLRSLLILELGIPQLIFNNIPHKILQ